MAVQTTSSTFGPNRDSSMKAICEELDEKSFRRNDTDCRYMFITSHVLEKIWTTECLQGFFEGFPWADKNFLETVRRKFLRVLSILVRIEWGGFENFKTAFYDNPGRQDSDLPFHDVGGIKQLDSITANNFSTRQYHFIPLTIEVNKDQKVSESHLFPFVKKSEVIAEEKGSFCIVYKEIVASRQLINSEGEPNANETQIVRKSCALSKAPGNIEGEVKALARFRSLLFNNERIMTSLCVIIHGDNLELLFPFADLDLEDLISDNPRGKLVSSASPRDLIIELAALADALGHLHYELRTSDGESLICVHNDLKPENILIFCGPEFPVGRWKIGDFGLASFKKVKGNVIDKDLYIKFNDSSFHHTLPSLTTPKRAPGSFQAPEVERQNEKVIGPESDVFSLGCISSRIVTYAVGGAKLVQDFDRKRGRESQHEDGSVSYGHDFYYRNDGREINIEVLSWLDELGDGKEEQTAWIRACVKIIKPMLEIDPHKRPKAHTVYLDLLDKVLPKFDNPTTSSDNESSSDIESSSESDSSTSAPQDCDEIKKKNQTPPHTPPIESLEVPPALYNDRPLRSFSYSFSKVKLLDHKVIQTAFSSSNEYMAYLSPQSVRILDLALLDQKDYWTEEEDPERLISDESMFLDIRASDTAFWRTMALSKDFLALRTADAVYLYKLKKAPPSKIIDSCIFERSKFKRQLFAVAVSANGDVILQFEKFLKIYVQSDAWESRILGIRGTLQSAAFNVNGDWIIAWSVDKGSLYSYFWQVSDLSQTHRRRISLPRYEIPCALNKQILACNGLPCFVAWDEPQGQVRIIHRLAPSQKESTSQELLDNIKVGIVTPAADAVVLIRKSYDGSSSADQVSIIPLFLNRDKVFELGKSLDICTTKASITNSCGITAIIDKESEMVKHILVAHLDGLIEKIELVYNEP